MQPVPFPGLCPALGFASAWGQQQGDASEPQGAEAAVGTTLGMLTENAPLPGTVTTLGKNLTQETKKQHWASQETVAA